jgi:Cu/Ag efflux pump CusA
MRFNRGVDSLTARQDVINRLRDFDNDFANVPPGVLPKISSSLVDSPAVLLVSIDSEQIKPAELGLLATARVFRQLRVIPGVADVIVAPRARLRYEVVVSADRLQQRSTAMSDVIEALRSSPLSAPEAKLPPDVELPRLVVNEEDGKPVRLQDVATIERRTVSTLGGDFEKLLPQTSPGRDVVLAVIVRQQEDAKAVAGRIDNRLAELRPKLPAGLTIGRKVALTEKVQATEAQTRALSPAQRALLKLPPAVAAAVNTLGRDMPPQFIVVPEFSSELGPVLRAKLRPGLRLQIIGPNWQALQQQSQDLRDRIAAVKGVFDVDWFGPKPQRRGQYKIDRNKAAELGIDVDEVLDVLEALEGGRVATQVNGPVEGSHCDVVVSYDQAGRREPLRVLLATPSGATIKLGQIAQRDTDQVPEQIYRKDGNRAAIVFWNTDPHAPQAAKEIHEIIRDVERKLPSGYHLQTH